MLGLFICNVVAVIVLSVIVFSKPGIPVSVAARTELPGGRPPIDPEHHRRG